jgi:hypothetical protein
MNKIKRTKASPVQRFAGWLREVYTLDKSEKRYYTCSPLTWLVHVIAFHLFGCKILENHAHYRGLQVG